MSQIEFDNTIR